MTTEDEETYRHRPLEDIMQSLHNESTTRSISNLSTDPSTINATIMVMKNDSSPSNMNSTLNNDNAYDKNKISFQKFGTSSINRIKKTKIAPENINYDYSTTNDNYLTPANHSLENRLTTRILEQTSSKQSSIIDGYINSIQSSFLVPKRLTVMIVDDSAMNRKIVRRTIEGYRNTNALTGCEVMIEEADDGLTAIEKYKSIISDNNCCADLIVLGEIYLVDMFLCV
jgi:hypothetical protein